MAPSWLSSRQSSGWSRSDDAPNMTRRLTLGAVAILVVGIVVGYSIKGIGSDERPSTASEGVIIANPQVSDIKTAPKTADGAVRAVTSYITGFPSVALMSTSDQRKLLDGVVSPNADPSLRDDLEALATQGRQRLFGAGASTDQVTARMVVTPASYKVDMLSAERARVQIWYMSVYIDANGQTANSSWTTVDIQVQWTDHWRLATYAAKGGPTPALYSDSTDPSSYSEVLTVFNGFKAFRYAPAVPTGK